MRKHKSHRAISFADPFETMETNELSFKSYGGIQSSMTTKDREANKTETSKVGAISKAQKAQM